MCCPLLGTQTFRYPIRDPSDCKRGIGDRAMSALGPKQESTFRPVWEDQRTFAPAMGMGKLDGLAGRIKAARLVVCQRSPQGR